MKLGNSILGGFGMVAKNKKGVENLRVIEEKRRGKIYGERQITIYKIK